MRTHASPVRTLAAFIEPSATPNDSPPHPLTRTKQGIVKGYPELVLASFRVGCVYAGVVLGCMILIFVIGLARPDVRCGFAFH